MSTETWRPIPDTNNRYEVSDRGRIRSLVSGEPHIMSPSNKGKKPHLMVNLVPVAGAKRQPTLVHRAVLAAFVGPCPAGYITRHLDGDATNNRVENLTYGTYSENELDAVRHGTHHNASKTHCKHGHEFTPENTYPQKGTGRGCRTCRRERSARRAA